METERVYAVWDYCGGIGSGIAEYLGSPHYFEQDWTRRPPSGSNQRDCS